MGANLRLGAYSNKNKYGIQLERRACTFGALLLISRNGFGKTNFSTAFRLRIFFSFFLVFFLLFFLCQFLPYFLDVFFDPLPSLTHSAPLPLCLPFFRKKKQQQQQQQ